MRHWWVLVALLVGLAAPAHAKRAPDPIQPTAAHQPMATDATEIAITASDEAGNTSTTLDSLRPNAYEGRRRHHCGMGAMAVIFIGIPVLVFVLCLALLFRTGYRRYKLKHPGDEVSPLVAEAMARAVVDAKVITIAIGFALSMALYFSDDGVYAALVAFVPASRLFHLIRARRFLASLETFGLPATMHDNLLAVHGDYIVVPRSIARDAKRRAVPAAIRR